MKLKFTLIALVAMLSGFAVNAANLQEADVLLPAGVSESSFGDNTVVDGTNYYATLQAAVEAVAGNEGAVLYCKPGADVGSLQHAPVTSTLTVYGNGAVVTGGSERDFDLGNTDPNGGRDITADMTLKVVSLNGCGAWGAKATEHTVNLIFENCENMGKVFITGTTGTLNISLTNCTFEGIIKEAVYSNADGNITLNNVAFSNLNKAINLNHKAAGTQTVTINGCSFTNCGANVNADEIPVRVLSSVEGGKSVLSVSNSTFSGTPAGGADILLDYGVGLTEATVATTTANVLPENKDGNAEMVAVTENEGYTNVESVAVAKIGETGYATFAEALTAAAAMTGDVTVEIYEKVTLAGPLAGSYSSIKFVGKAENAEIYLDIQGYSEATGKKVVFEDLKLSKVAGGYVTNAGFMNLAFGVYGATEATYTNCTFLNGAYASTGDVTFANCTFYRSHDRYGLWAYGNANITVDGCKFADIRGIKMYVESKEQESAATLTVKNTDFTTADNKPAIVLTYGKSVTLEGNTYSGTGVFELDLDGKPNGVAVTSDVAPTCVNDNGACGVLVDGKIYTTVAQAAAVATSGSNVTLLHNSAETVEFPEGVVLDKNGFEAAGVNVAQPVAVAKVGGVDYATLSEAFAAVTDDNQTVVLLADVTENLTGAYLRGNITTENGAKVTVTLTNNDWVYCPYTFVLGENITLNVPALFYYAGGTQINGTLVVDAYYQRYAGIKLTINEPGSMTVKTEQFNLRLADGDANAGIYINGDNNDATVGLNLSVAYFYQGTIYAKNANVKTAVYWQTNDTDNQGSANLVLDNSKLVVTGYENIAKFTGNSTVTLKNESVIDASNCGFTYGDNTSFSIDATSKIIGKNGDFVAQLPNAEVVNLGHVTVGPEAEGVYNTDSYYVYDLINGGGLASAEEPFNLQIAMNFKAKDSAEQAAANMYGNYTTDFYITMTGINGGSFEADGCYLAGYYPSFNAWVKIPLDGFAVENGKVYPVITAAGFDFKYTDICGEVKDFICGIYLTPEVLAANPDLKVELSLGLSKNMDAALAANFIKVDSYTYDAEALTPPVTQLPNAEVVNLGHVTVGPEAEGVYNTDSYYVYDLINGGGLASAEEPFNLQIAMNFKAKDTAEEAAANAYGNYTTDFYITMTGINGNSFEADGCYLAGYYPSFDAWVKIPLDGFTVENGNVYPVITAAGFDFKYIDICREVKDFICGIYLTPEVLAANPDLKVELSLGLSKDMNAALAANFIEVDSYEYTAEDFECPLSGEGTEASPFLIKNVNDLVLFRNSVNSGETKYNAPGVWVALGADIDLAGITWTEGIGDGHNWSFDGNFDGKNYTIKNLTVKPYVDDNKYLCGGLFGYIYGGVTIKNLTIENATIEFVGEEGKDYFNVGVLVGFANNNGGKANISNITVKGDIKVNAPNAYGVGAIVGYSYRDMGTITNCTVEANNGSYIKGYSFVGGITGYSYAGATIAGCSVKNIDITATNYSVAGIAGLASANNTVSNSVVENVTVNGEANVGNVIGAIAANGIVVENCTAAEPLVGGNYSDNKAVEARIGNKYYATLEEALKADGNEVELLVPITVPAGKEVTLDLNGKTVSQSKACTASYEMINNKGDLTIKNGTLSFTDTSAGDPSFGWGSYTVRNEGTLVVENATIEHLGAQAFGTHMICAIFQYSGSTTINGGTISTSNYRSVRLWKGDMTINGGTFDGQVWVQSVDNTADLTINGGTFEPNGRDASSVFIGNVTEDVHYAAAFSVTDGTFNGKIGCNDTEKLTGDLIAGGTFSATAKENTNVALLATGYVFESNENGTFGVTENPDYISELTLIDGQFDAYDYATNKTVGTFTYKRTFSGLNWNAFYVPFEIEMSKLIENYDIAYINDVNSYDNDNNGEIDEMKMEVIKITDENATLLANHPYLIRPKNEEALAFSITLYDVTLFAAEEVTLDCTSMYTKFEVTGSYRRRTTDDLNGKLVLSGAGEWITMTVGTMNPCRLILTITSREGSPVKISTAAAKSIRIVTRGEIDGTTGIEGVEYESTDAIYDLSGRRVNEITKAGVYVVNGKKVLVK